MDSPTSRSLQRLREDGWMAQKVEHWNAFSHRSIDLFSVIDIVAVKQGCLGVLGVQTTTSANLAARREKCRASQALKLWLQCGNSFVLHGWAKYGERGKRKVWKCRHELIRAEDIRSDL